MSDIISDFNVDGAEVLMGKQSPSVFLKKYGVGESETAAKEYLKALTEGNQIANQVARATGNLDNMFSDYIPDMLYGNYLPEKFYLRNTEVGMMREGEQDRGVYSSWHLLRAERVGLPKPEKVHRTGIKRQRQAI